MEPGAEVSEDESGSIESRTEPAQRLMTAVNWGAGHVASKLNASKAPCGVNRSQQGLSRQALMPEVANAPPHHFVDVQGPNPSVVRRPGFV